MVQPDTFGRWHPNQDDQSECRKLRHPTCDLLEYSFPLEIWDPVFVVPNLGRFIPGMKSIMTKGVRERCGTSSEYGVLVLDDMKCWVTMSREKERNWEGLKPVAGTPIAT